MLSSYKRWIAYSALALSSSAFASVDTADFNSRAPWGPINGIEERIFSTTLSGTDVWISGWSDTLDNGNDGAGDNTLTSQNLVQYTSGWGIVNSDEYYDEPNHSVDNIRSHDGSDDGIERDYDFFLLDFGSAVTLTQAQFGWVNGNNSQNQNQVTFAALNDVGNQSNTLYDLTNSTMAQLQSMVIGGVGNGSGYSQILNNGSYYADVNIEQSSSLWIVSAFNSTFGGSSDLEGNDGFKLSGISFTKKIPDKPGDKIPEPSTILLMLIALIGFTRKSIVTQ